MDFHEKFKTKRIVIYAKWFLLKYKYHIKNGTKKNIDFDNFIVEYNKTPWHN